MSWHHPTSRVVAAATVKSLGLSRTSKTGLRAEYSPAQAHPVVPKVAWPIRLSVLTCAAVGGAMCAG